MTAGKSVARVTVEGAARDCTRATDFPEVINVGYCPSCVGQQVIYYIVHLCERNNIANFSNSQRRNGLLL